jgi:hypothetical protein
MSASGLTPRTMAVLRKLGYRVGKVEYFNYWSKQSHDLFNVIDLIAMKPGVLIGVQSTSVNHRKEHVDKILSEPLAKVWCETGAWLWMVSWRKEKIKRGGVAIRWVPVFDFFNANSDWRIDGDNSGEDCIPSEPGRASGSGDEEDIHQGIGDWNRGGGDSTP